jgi:hypothetical protein
MNAVVLIGGDPWRIVAAIRALRALGHRVLWAADLDEAARLIRESPALDLLVIECRPKAHASDVLCRQLEQRLGDWSVEPASVVRDVKRADSAAELVLPPSAARRWN